MTPCLTLLVLTGLVVLLVWSARRWTGGKCAVCGSLQPRLPHGYKLRACGFCGAPVNR